LESNRIRDKRRRAPIKHVRGQGVGGSGREGRREKAARLADPVTQLLEFLFMKNVLVVLGEELVDPQEEGLFLDVNQAPGLDDNSGNGEGSFLPVDACLVRFSIDSSGIMAKAPM